MQFKVKKEDTIIIIVQTKESRGATLIIKMQLPTEQNKFMLCFNFKTYIEYMDALKERRTGAATPLSPPQSRP